MDWSVLQAIRRRGATPQHKLAGYLGRQGSIVNGTVQRLVTSGRLPRVGQEGYGRPATLRAVSRSAGCFGRIDIAANDLHCVVAAAGGPGDRTVAGRNAAIAPAQPSRAPRSYLYGGRLWLKPGGMRATLYLRLCEFLYPGRAAWVDCAAEVGCRP